MSELKRNNKAYMYRKIKNQINQCLTLSDLDVISDHSSKIVTRSQSCLNESLVTSTSVSSIRNTRRESLEHMQHNDYYSTQDIIDVQVPNNDVEREFEVAEANLIQSDLDEDGSCENNLSNVEPDSDLPDDSS